MENPIHQSVCVAETAHDAWTFRRIVKLIILLQRFLALLSGDYWDENPSNPVKPKQKLSLGELSQPGARVKITEQIQHRLHHTSRANSTGSEVSSSALSKCARDILSNSPWTRTLAQVETKALLISFAVMLNMMHLAEVHHELQCCEAYKDYPLYIQKSLCKVGWYQRVTSGRVILRQGHPPSCFYFLLSGAVQLLKDAKMAVNTLTAGVSFGVGSALVKMADDTAIVNDSKRTTTCRAESDVELLVMSKSDYLDLSLRQALKSYQRTKHFAFCRTVHILKHWPLHLLESHPENCKINHFKPNTIIVRNSHRCDWIYVVMSGSCRVVKRFVDSSDQMRNGRKHKSLPGEFHRSKLALASQSVALDPSAGPMTLPFLPQKQEHSEVADSVSRHRSYPRVHGSRTVGCPQALMEKQSSSIQRKQFLIQLQLLQPKDVFGLSTFIYEDEPSVTLVSNGAELVMISKEFISHHITESVKSKLKRQVVRFPSQDAMLKRIREHQAWTGYKQTLVNPARRRL